MTDIFKYLSEAYKGIILIISGLILLLHTLGLIERGLDIIIIIGALYMIALGFEKTQYHKKIIALVQRKEEKK